MSGLELHKTAQNFVPSPVQPPLSRGSVIFLGFARDTQQIAFPNARLPTWNISGLSSFIPAYFYPILLDDLRFALALRHEAVGHDLRVKIRKNGTKLLGLNFSVSATSSDGANVTTFREADETWVTVFSSLRNRGFSLLGSGNYTVHLLHDDGYEENIGAFYTSPYDAPTLTPERIAAIKSDPRALKRSSLTTTCRKCGDIFKTYTGLSRSSKYEKQGYRWYEELPDQFSCTCGQTKIDLALLRKNFHAALGSPQDIGGHNLLQKSRGSEPETDSKITQNIDSVSLYTSTELRSVRDNFAKLIQSTCSEETIQKFIEANELLLQRFSAIKLFRKPPILTFHKADFAILTPEKHLLLIEIERANLKILKKDGAQTKDLTHAFHQVENWLSVTRNHLSAVLKCLDLDEHAVSMVRGVVIAGRDCDCRADHLTQLKGRDVGPISFCTYDDLLAAFDAFLINLTRRPALTGMPNKRVRI